MPDPVKADGNIPSEVKVEWNNYVDYLEKKGLKGSKELDKGKGDMNVGRKVLAEYIKSNPDTLLTLDMVGAIQNEFTKTKSKLESDIKQGKISTTAKEVLPNLSKQDIYPGSKTTTYKFPTAALESKLKDVSTGKITKLGTEQLGFVSTKAEQSNKDVRPSQYLLLNNSPDKATFDVKNTLTGKIKYGVSKDEWSKAQNNPEKIYKLFN